MDWNGIFRQRHFSLLRRWINLSAQYAKIQIQTFILHMNKSKWNCAISSPLHEIRLQRNEHQSNGCIVIKIFERWESFSSKKCFSMLFEKHRFLTQKFFWKMSYFILNRQQYLNIYLNLAFCLTWKRKKKRDSALKAFINIFTIKNKWFHCFFVCFRGQHRRYTYVHVLSFYLYTLTHILTAVFFLSI